MPFTKQYLPANRGPQIAVVFIVATVTFLIGLGIGLGQGLRAAGNEQFADSDTGVEEHRTLFGSIVSGIGSKPPRGEVQDADFDLFWEVWQDAKKSFYKQPVEDRDLFYGAVEGIAHALDDPYT
ncbi:hypothetical protein GF380_03655, partial [Candidatus Uhrbacteria bacterium]|nr:hypothetical protein [Candidatus Uhrbacteria bacterium]